MSRLKVALDRRNLVGQLRLVGLDLHEAAKVQLTIWTALGDLTLPIRCFVRRDLVGLIVISACHEHLDPVVLLLELFVGHLDEHVVVNLLSSRIGFQGSRLRLLWLHRHAIVLHYHHRRRHSRLIPGIGRHLVLHELSKLSLLLNGSYSDVRVFRRLVQRTGEGQEVVVVESTVRLTSSLVPVLGHYAESVWSWASDHLVLLHVVLDASSR